MALNDGKAYYRKGRYTSDERDCRAEVRRVNGNANGTIQEKLTWYFWKYADTQKMLRVFILQQIEHRDRIKFLENKINDLTPQRIGEFEN